MVHELVWYSVDTVYSQIDSVSVPYQIFNLYSVGTEYGTLAGTTLLYSSEGGGAKCATRAW